MFPQALLQVDVHKEFSPAVDCGLDENKKYKKWIIAALSL